MSQEEKKQIKEMAALHRMKTSEFVRVAVLGYQPISIIESQKMDQLFKVNSDLARLGNLLKYWLVNDPKLQKAHQLKIEEILLNILDVIHEQRLKIYGLVEEMHILIRAINKDK